MGQSGSLDYALTSTSLKAQVTGATVWHINADEPIVLSYNTEFKTDGPFDISDPYRSSDHDPVLVGLNLTNSTSVPATSLSSIAGLVFALAAAGTLLIRNQESAKAGQ